MHVPRPMLLVVVGAACLIPGCTQDHRSRVDEQTRLVGRDKWPKALVEFLDEAARNGAHAENVQVYYSGYDEYYWRCKYTPELFDFINRRLNLVPVDRNHKALPFVLKYFPSDLLAVVPMTDDLDFYLSANFAAGEDGDQYCIINNKTRNLVVIRYYFNF